MDGYQLCTWIGVQRPRNNVQDVRRQMKVTLEHMLRCPNERMEVARSDAIQCVRTKGLAQDFTKPFMTCVTHYLKRALEELEWEYDQEVQRVFDSQDAIGPMMFVRGYISREWVSLGQSMAIQSIKQKLPKLVTLIYPIVWDEVVGQLWSMRNDMCYTGAPTMSWNWHKHRWGIDFSGIYSIRMNCHGEIRISFDSIQRRSMQWWLLNDRNGFDI